LYDFPLLSEEAASEEAVMAHTDHAPSNAQQQEDQSFESTDSVLVPDGFSLAPLATGLNCPTAIASSKDHIWVIESGAVPDVMMKAWRER
jgi:hypothetical protein